MIPYVGAVASFVAIFTELPLPFKEYIITFACLGLGFNFLKWLAEVLK
ncbi:MAG: hypothetical protein HFF90_12010 [Oscillibacter sp.]|nr:hypothetical protein [Oscillibacter sp.]